VTFVISSILQTYSINNWVSVLMVTFTASLNRVSKKYVSVPIFMSACFVVSVMATDVSAQNTHNFQNISAEDSLRAGLMASEVLEAERQAFVVARQAIATSNAKNNLTGNFALSGSHLQTDEKDSAGGFTSSNKRVGAVTLKKQLYDFGEADSRMEAARYGLDSARASYMGAEQQVILDILSAHLKVITAQKAFDIRTANRERLDAQTQAENIKLDAGTSTPTRLAEAEARLARAVSDQILAEAELISAQEAYNSLTHNSLANSSLANSSLANNSSDSLGNFRLLPLNLEKVTLPASLQDAEQMAIREHPSILAVLALEKQAAMEFQILKTSLLPKVNLSLSAVQNDQKGTSMDKDEVTTKLEFSTPFLVTEGSRAADRRAMAGLNQMRAQLAETRRVVGLAARKAYRDYQAAQGQLGSVEAEIRAARLVASGTASEVEYGLKTFLDLLDAEQLLSDTELRLVQTQEAIVLNGYRLLQATGQLSVEMFLPADILPALDSINDPASRYPFIIAIPSKSRVQ
jgi:outer membrane protein